MKSIDDKENQDIKLIERTVGGDEVAFEQLVQKYQHSVLNTIYRYIGDSADAEDIAQEVFVKVWQHAKSFKGQSEFSTWLYRIVVNQCLNFRAKRKKKTISLDELTESGNLPNSLKVGIEYPVPTGSLSGEDRKRASIVRKAVDELPKRQRIALVLSKFEGKSYKEIAQIMRTSLSSVESLIFRAKENLGGKLLPLREKGEI